MRQIATREDVDAFRAALASRATAAWSLFERGKRVAGLGDTALEIGGDARTATIAAGGRLWRVVGFEERRGDLVVAVRGPFGRVSKTLRIAREPLGEPYATGEEWFEEAVRRFVEKRWGPDYSLGATGDRLLGRVRRPNGERATVVAVAPWASERSGDDALAAGLVARDALERSRRRACALYLLAAAPALSRLAERIAWLRPRANVHLFDVASPEGEVRPHDQGSLASGRILWPRPSLEPNALVERLLAVDAALRRDRRPGASVDRITLRGVEVARVRNETATFWVDGRRVPLDDRSWPRFVSRVAEVAYYRSGEAPARQHALYRLYPERWLSSLVRDDVRVVDPLLDPATVYEQVPARRRDSRDFVDLLAVTRDGRLAVVELKAAESRALPIQGLNYWSRVRWHHARGEIARRGYFPGVELDARPPLLYLVAPLFRTHRSVRIAVELFAPDVEAVVVGLNTDWRSGPRAIARYSARGRAT